MLNRYLRLMTWAYYRYLKDGCIILSVGGQPTAYTRIEQAAWNKYIVGGEK